MQLVADKGLRTIVTAMNDMRAISPAKGWVAANLEFNHWRGAALHCLTQAEDELTTVLRRLSGKKAPALVGARYNALLTLLRADQKHSKIVAALEGFAPQLELRIALCHGVAKLLLDRNGQWLVRMRWQDPAKPDRTAEYVIDQEEAAAALIALQKEVQALSTQLRKVPTA